MAEVDGRELTRIDDLYSALDALEQGSKLTLVVVRGSEERTIEVTL